MSYCLSWQPSWFWSSGGGGGEPSNKANDSTRGKLSRSARTLSLVTCRRLRASGKLEGPHDIFHSSPARSPRIHAGNLEAVAHRHLRLGPLLCRSDVLDRHAGL